MFSCPNLWGLDRWIDHACGQHFPNRPTVAGTRGFRNRQHEVLTQRRSDDRYRDGANIEIRDTVGAENIFIFGNSTLQVEALRQSGYDPRAIYQNNPALNETLNKIDGGFFPQ